MPTTSGKKIRNSNELKSMPDGRVKQLMGVCLWREKLQANIALGPTGARQRPPGGCPHQGRDRPNGLIHIIPHRVVYITYIIRSRDRRDCWAFGRSRAPSLGSC